MDERASKREVVDLEVRAVRAGETFRALVYDLSVDGCMIATDGEPALCAGDATSVGGISDLAGRSKVSVYAMLGDLTDKIGRSSSVLHANPSVSQDAAPLSPREQERAPVVLRCEARVGLGGWNFAILLDLSTHGFQLVRAPGCEVGATVKLRIPGMEMLTAVVKWMTLESIGCAFVRPLSPYVFEHVVKNTRA